MLFREYLSFCFTQSISPLVFAFHMRFLVRIFFELQLIDLRSVFCGRVERRALLGATLLPWLAPFWLLSCVLYCVWHRVVI